MYKIYNVKPYKDENLETEIVTRRVSKITLLTLHDKKKQRIFVSRNWSH